MKWLGIFFVTFGIILTILSSNVIEYEKRYDDICTDPNCDITIEITEKMEAPVFLYYGLENFYQNHRKYMKSRDTEQLAGKIKTADELDDCEPIIYNKDIAPNLKSYDGYDLNPDAVANPCGLVAKSFFTGNRNSDFYHLLDTFQLFLGATQIPINENGIAWESDIKHKFKLPPNSNQIQWIKVTDGIIFESRVIE